MSDKTFEIQITAEGNTLFANGKPTPLSWEELPIIKLILFQKKGIVRDVIPQMLVDRLKTEDQFKYLNLTDDDCAAIKQLIMDYLDGK